MNTEFLRILAFLIIVAVITLLLKEHRPELAILISFAVTAGILIVLLHNVYPSINRVWELFSKSNNSSAYFATALKALVIAYIAGFAADTCRDFGQSSLATKAELAGKCAVFILSVPLMCSVLEAALGYAGL